MQPGALAAFAYLSLMWGSTYLFIKIGTAYWPPLLMAVARNSLACVCVVAVLFLLRRAWPANWRGWWPPIGFGVINGSAFALIFWGQPYIPSGQTAVFIATMPLFTLFIAWLWFHEPVTWFKTLAIGIGLGGVLLAVGHRDGVGFAGTDLQRLLGQMAMLGAALCYATSYLFGRRFFQADIYANTAIHLGSSSLYLLVLSLLFDPPVTAAIFSAPAIWSVLYLAVPGTAVAYWCMFYLIQNASSLQTSYFSVINPVVSLLLGWVFLQERLTTAALVGSALVLVGVWLVIRPAPGAAAPGVGT